MMYHIYIYMTNLYGRPAAIQVSHGRNDELPLLPMPLAQGPLVEVERWSQAVVADHALLHGLPATSCLTLQSGAPYSTSAPPSYLSDPLLRPLQDERPAGRPARPQSAVRHCTLLGVASGRPRLCCHWAMAQRSPRRAFLDGAILQHIVEEPMLSEQLNAWKLPWDHCPQFRNVKV